MVPAALEAEDPIATDSTGAIFAVTKNSFVDVSKNMYVKSNADKTVIKEMLRPLLENMIDLNDEKSISPLEYIMFGRIGRYFKGFLKNMLN